MLCPRNFRKAKRNNSKGKIYSSTSSFPAWFYQWTVTRHQWKLGTTFRCLPSYDKSVKKQHSLSKTECKREICLQVSAYGPTLQNNCEKCSTTWNVRIWLNYWIDKKTRWRWSIAKRLKFKKRYRSSWEDTRFCHTRTRERREFVRRYSSGRPEKLSLMHLTFGEKESRRVKTMMRMSSNRREATKSCPWRRKC